jgi:ornithine carbamoyltransferase
MSCTIPHRHLWSPERLSAAELHALLDSAAEVKRAKQRDPDWAPLRGRHIAVLAQHNDDATAGFERAVRELGGKATRLDGRAWQSSAAARVSDAARMLGRLYEAIDCSDLPVPLLEQIDAHCGVPVFNGLARPDHPLSAVGALLTMREASGKPLERLHVQLGGDANSPRQRGAAALARLVGIDARPRMSVAIIGAAEAAGDEPDFTFDPLAAPGATERLIVPDATRDEQARITALLAHNTRCALQAMLVCSLQ